ncbi:putative Ig domain-containing protein [Paraburkholderia sediminicola]|nr:putative Ig domain-containing protein [Paraburkholderia sediminicola]
MIHNRGVMNRYLLAGLLFLAALVAGCHGGGDDDLSAAANPPTGLTYRDTPVVYVQGVAITPNTPSSSGGPIVGYSVSPVLPAGLRLDPQTGIITGTPAAVTEAALYTVTGSNASGSASARVQIEVKATAIAPDSLRYLDESVIYPTGVPITPNEPVTSGGEITQFSVSPALPSGLSLDPQTGIISGTPTAVTAPATYVVTGSNSAGSVTAQLAFEVRAQLVAPASLQYTDPVPVYAVGQAIVPNVPQATGGEITQFSVSPALPAGLSLNTQTGVIGGTPASLQAQTAYTVTGSNAAGTAQTQAQITVNSAGAWLPADSMATSRVSHTATLLPDGKVLVAGGEHIGGGPVVLSSAELYDPASDTWSTTGNMTTARDSSAGTLQPHSTAHTATLLPNGKVLVAGGNDSNPLASAELYDPASGTWSATGSMATAHQFHTATLLAGGKVLVAGGVNPGGIPISSAELYDPASGTWSTTGSMATARGKHTATLLADGKVLVAGGDVRGANDNSAELYDPASGTWSPTGSMAESRPGGFTVTLLSNGKVLAAAGLDGAGQQISSAELYDPASGTWSTTGSLSRQGRAYHTATLLPDGKVLVAGSCFSGGASTELYDPASGTWSPPGSMAEARYSHTATLLPDGRVLVVGGENPRGGNSSASAVLFH